MNGIRNQNFFKVKSIRFTETTKSFLCISWHLLTSSRVLYEEARSLKERLTRFYKWEKFFRTKLTSFFTLSRALRSPSCVALNYFQDGLISCRLIKFHDSLSLVTSRPFSRFYFGEKLECILNDRNKWSKILKRREIPQHVSGSQNGVWLPRQSLSFRDRLCGCSDKLFVWSSSQWLSG